MATKTENAVLLEFRVGRVPEVYEITIVIIKQPSFPRTMTYSP